MLRVTLFAQSPWELAPDGALSSVFGVRAESTSSQAASGESSAIGIWGPGSVEIKRVLTRLDFLVQPQMQVPSPSELPRIVNIQESLRQLIEKVAGWILKQNTVVVRIAVGLECHQAGSDRADVYHKLKSLVQIVALNPEKHRDFHLQINVPVQSDAMPGLSINCLSQWMAAQLGFRAFVSGAQGMLPVITKHQMRCSVDINTDADRSTPLQIPLLPGLLTEAASLGMNILSRGVR